MSSTVFTNEYPRNDVSDPVAGSVFGADPIDLIVAER
jgi:hypothetical protein